jgi:hypothetical protein
MVRMLSFLLSFWLALLFVVGQGSHSPRLLVFFVGVGAVLAAIGGSTAPLMKAGLRLGLSIAFALGLFAIWAVALAMHVSVWLPWCVFMGAFCFIGVVIAEVIWSPRNRGTMAPADS